jgi:hypothetical protein
VPAQDALQIRNSSVGENGSCRVLCPRRHHNRPAASPQCRLKRIGLRTFVVNRNGLRYQSRRRQKMENPRKDRILHADSIAGPKVFSKDQIYSIQSSAHDSQRGGRNAVGLQLTSGEPTQRSQRRRLAVEAGLTAD